MKSFRRIDLFKFFNVFILILISFTMLYPFINILALSLNDAMDAQRGGIYFLPRKFTLNSYFVIFQTQSLLRATFITVSRTVLGTLLTVLCSAMFAFTFTRKDYILYKPMKIIFFIALFFGGVGLIPTYMLYNKLLLLNKFAVYILPTLVNLFFVIVARTYFSELPVSVTESAMLDGANELVIFFRIVFPLSAPIIAYVALNVAVYQWNAWQDTLFFTNGGNLKTLQYVMMEVMLKSEANQIMARSFINLRKSGINNTVDPKSIQMAITMIVTVPILCVYPFLQKYFVKGILVGSLKG